VPLPSSLVTPRLPPRWSTRVADDRQADARPSPRPGRRRDELVGLEQRRQDVLRVCRARCRRRRSAAAAAVAHVSIETRTSPDVGVADRVDDEVGQHLVDAGAIGDREQRRGGSSTAACRPFEIASSRASSAIASTRAHASNGSAWICSRPPRPWQGSAGRAAGC
jgi:hypothetical protein